MLISTKNKNKKNYKDEDGFWHIVEFADRTDTFVSFKCPLCGNYHNCHINVLKKDYDGKRKFKCFFRHENKSFYIVDPE